MTILRTEPGLSVAVSFDAQSCASKRVRSPIAMGPGLGTMCSRTTPSSRSNVDRRRSVRVSTHLFIQPPMLLWARVGSI